MDFDFEPLMEDESFQSFLSRTNHAEENEDRPRNQLRTRGPREPAPNATSWDYSRVEDMIQQALDRRLPRFEAKIASLERDKIQIQAEVNSLKQMLKDLRDNTSDLGVLRRALRPFADEEFVNHKYPIEKNYDIYANLQSYLGRNGRNLRLELRSEPERISFENFARLDRQALRRSAQISSYLEHRFSTNRHKIYSFVLEVISKPEGAEDLYVVGYLQGMADHEDSPNRAQKEEWKEFLARNFGGMHIGMAIFDKVRSEWPRVFQRTPSQSDLAFAYRAVITVVNGQAKSMRTTYLQIKRQYLADMHPDDSDMEEEEEETGAEAEAEAEAEENHDREEAEEEAVERAETVRSSVRQLVRRSSRRS